jgi:hypothetical protein
MAKFGWENLLLVLLTTVVLGIVAYRAVNSDINETDVSPTAIIQQEMEWASQIEGASDLEIFGAEFVDDWKRVRNKGGTQPKFIVIISDSSCKPCFGNLVKEYVQGLKENKCTIDPSQWIGIYVGQNSGLGESTFRGVFGAKASYKSVPHLDQRFFRGNDGVILFSTNNNTILACTKIGRPLEMMKSYFVKRVVNALNAHAANNRR